MEKLFFFSLASGSSGNCYYLGASSYGILIDAGIGSRQIKKTLKEYGVEMEKILAVLVTHDHADHIKSVGYLGEVQHIPVYATELVHAGIRRSRYVEETLIGSRRVVEKEAVFSIRDFNITAFEVPHDSSDNVGYLIEYGNNTFVIATDVGHITDTIKKYICRANHLVIEANYDEEMLISGAYPFFLKERVSSPSGHLSNHETAEFLATNYTPKLKNIWLCHLSRDNNHPELAYKTVDLRLFQEGIRVGKDVVLTTLKRMIPSEMYEFEVKLKGTEDEDY
ncbi:MAG: MBL fold metallo-hydrolase [Tannerella sp.]|jgi:phosphoribosyl 1,2-cyclic phosphodiesterase|nr:MBL fold metallo-hydrolase [Tannerella sp.]